MESNTRHLLFLIIFKDLKMVFLIMRKESGLYLGNVKYNLVFF